MRKQCYIVPWIERIYPLSHLKYNTDIDYCIKDSVKLDSILLIYVANCDIVK